MSQKNAVPFATTQRSDENENAKVHERSPYNRVIEKALLEFGISYPVDPVDPV